MIILLVALTLVLALALAALKSRNELVFGKVEFDVQNFAMMIVIYWIIILAIIVIIHLVINYKILPF